MAYTGNVNAGTTRDTATTLHDIKEKGVDQFNQVASSIEDAAGKVAERGREAGEQIQKVAGNVQTSVNQSLRDQPMATLAVVAAIGFVLGALWKS